MTGLARHLGYCCSPTYLPAKSCAACGSSSSQCRLTGVTYFIQLERRPNRLNRLGDSRITWFLIDHSRREREAAGMAVSDDLRERVVEAVVLGVLSRNRAAAFPSERSERGSLGEAVPNHGRDFGGAFWRRPPRRPDRGASRLSLGPGPAQPDLTLLASSTATRSPLKKTAHAEEQQRADVQKRRRRASARSASATDSSMRPWSRRTFPLLR